MKKGYTNISEENIKLKTGESTAQWTKLLDKFNVKKHGHTLTARFLREKYHLSGWWSQVITIRYEKGLRK